MKKYNKLFSLSILIFLVFSSYGLATNIAFGKTVTLHGDFFQNGWGGGTVADPQSIVDGTFLPRGTQWDLGPVWWDDHTDPGKYITIDLGGVYNIESFIVQADDNDAYLLEYWDMTSSNWQTAWDIPTRYAWGMQTRPNPLDDTERYTILGSPIVTNALKISGSHPSDLYYSVSEIKAFGAAVPEPASLILVSMGLLGLAALKRKKS